MKVSKSFVTSIDTHLRYNCKELIQRLSVLGATCFMDYPVPSRYTVAYTSQTLSLPKGTHMPRLSHSPTSQASTAQRVTCSACSHRLYSCHFCSECSTTSVGSASAMAATRAFSECILMVFPGDNSNVPHLHSPSPNQTQVSRFPEILECDKLSEIG